jgi:3-deoxy-D-manno-octulosonate 8-phosphate phosphatase (KDO 8-P phosphatase)
LDFSKLYHITTFLFDVDGVFTDGNVIVTEAGEMLRTMSTRDGQAVKIALDAGYKVIIITKGFSEGVRKRFEVLGVTEVYDRLKEKTTAFNDACEKYNLNKEELLYMGDDIPDLPLMDMVSIATCPADAISEVIDKADYISPYKGGQGCVRDIVEKVMRLQGKWPTQLT